MLIKPIFASFVLVLTSLGFNIPHPLKMLRELENNFVDLKDSFNASVITKLDSYIHGLNLQYKIFMKETHNITSDILNKTLPQFSFSFPGTNWCGPGNTATDYNDIGENISTDKCCRDHDHCHEYMSSGELKHNITNTGRFTKLHCTCDNDFLACLKAADTMTSKEVGIMYFDIVPTQCYMDAPLIMRCKTSKRKYMQKRCLEYEYNTGRAKKYQWFDIPFWH